MWPKWQAGLASPAGGAVEKLQPGDCDQAGAGQEEAHLQQQVISGSQGHINYLHHRHLTWWWGQDRTRHKWAGDKARGPAWRDWTLYHVCQAVLGAHSWQEPYARNKAIQIEYKTRMNIISFSLNEKCCLVGPGRVIISHLGYWQREIIYELYRAYTLGTKFLYKLWHF